MNDFSLVDSGFSPMYMHISFITDFPLRQKSKKNTSGRGGYGYNWDKDE